MNFIRVPIYLELSQWNLFKYKHPNLASQRIRELINIDLGMYSPELEEYQQEDITNLQTEIEQRKTGLMKESKELTSMISQLDYLKKKQEQKIKEKETEIKLKAEEEKRIADDFQNTFRRTKWDKHHEWRTL